MERKHIVAKFDRELSEIEDQVVKMADWVADQVRDAAKALVTQDDKLAKQVAKRDREVNRMEERLDQRTIRLMALRQPMGEDLRLTVATLKISGHLERLGDYAKTTCYRVRAVDDFSAMKSVLQSISDLSDKVVTMISLAIEAYVNRDLEKAREVMAMDIDINDRTDGLLREVLTYMLENPRNIEPCTHLLFISKNMERSGDQAKNIAEQVRYLVTGELAED
ncbi:MAG: phosphate signaling complex protein PhoU [Pseudomonadota bacterium]